MEIKIIKTPISRSELLEIAKEQFGDFVKAVVDVESEVMAIGSELHADAEALLLQHGSRREHVWGINLYPEKQGDEFVEFNSMINIKPSQGNRSRGVEDTYICDKIKAVVEKLVV